jgi:hypothetical protein
VFCTSWNGIITIVTFFFLISYYHSNIIVSVSKSTTMACGRVGFCAHGDRKCDVDGRPHTGPKYLMAHSLDGVIMSK